MEHKQTMTSKQQDVGADHVVALQTTKVTTTFSGTISYYGNPSSGTLFTFTKPSMEMLPGNVKFVLRNPDGSTFTKVIAISGCLMEIPIPQP